MATDQGATDSSLERELDRMLEIEKFEPPAEFRERASWTDPAIYEEAAADPVAWWTARSKELLDWDVEPTTGLNDSDPPFYKWFEDGRLNASAQCLDRHVAAGIGDRVAYLLIRLLRERVDWHGSPFRYAGRPGSGKGDQSRPGASVLVTD